MAARLLFESKRLLSWPLWMSCSWATTIKEKNTFAARSSVTRSLFTRSPPFDRRGSRGMARLSEFFRVLKSKYFMFVSLKKTHEKVRRLTLRRFILFVTVRALLVMQGWWPTVHL